MGWGQSLRQRDDRPLSEVLIGHPLRRLPRLPMWQVEETYCDVLDLMEHSGMEFEPELGPTPPWPADTPFFCPDPASPYFCATFRSRPNECAFAHCPFMQEER